MNQMNKKLKSPFVIILMLVALGVASAGTYTIGANGNIFPSTAIHGHLMVNGTPWIDVRLYGADGTDTNADHVAIQTAIDGAPVGATIYIPKGHFYVDESIEPKDNIRILGAGMFNGTILHGTALLGDSSVIQHKKGSSNYLEDFEISDLEIEGSAMRRTGYSAFRKAIYFQYFRRNTYRDLYLHDTPATCLGIDFVEDSFIDHIIVENCGTSGQILGSNGIGIGTILSEEPLIITNSIAKNIENNGIMFEEQTHSVETRHVIMDNNIAYGCDNAGFLISGTSGVVMTANIAYGNVYGVRVRTGTFKDIETDDITISNNEIYENTHSGIYINHEGKKPVNNLLISDNTIGDSANYGIYVSGAGSVKISDNIISNSGDNGILVKVHTNDMDWLTIQDNTISYSGMSGAADTDDAIQIRFISADLGYCKLDDNLIINATGAGIKTYQSSTGNVTGFCTFFDNLIDETEDTGFIWTLGGTKYESYNCIEGVCS